MARIRSVKPTFFTSLPISELSDAARLTFIGLWTYADDEGRGVDDARLVKAAIWPADDAKTTKKVEALVKELADKGRIVRYEVDGRRYFQVTNWKEHQKIDRATASVIPPPRLDAASPNGQRDSSDGSLPEGKGEEGKGTPPPSVGDTTARPPTPEEERIAEAARIVSDRHFARASNVKNPLAWKQEDLRRVFAEHGERMKALVIEHPDVTANELAYWCETGRPPVRFIARGEVETFEPPDPEFVKSNIDAARAAVGGQG